MTDRTMSAATPDWRAVAGGLALCAAVIMFGYGIKNLSAINDWWIDELYSLFASDPSLGFGDLLRHRILTDVNPPLYYMLLLAVRRVIPDPRTAILVLNGILLCATAMAMGLIGRRHRMLGFALAGFAVFLVSGPVLRFAVQGRGYVLALMLTYVAAWLGALALTAPTPRPAWWYWPLLGALTALAHLFAALFCGCLAAALLLSSLTGRRRDLIMPALMLGGASSATLILWFLLFGSATTASAAWLALSSDSLIAAEHEVTQMIFGVRFGTVRIVPIAFAAVFLLTLCVARTRPLAILAGVTAMLFLAVPCALSLARPIIQGRYWLIGTPIVFVFLTFLARAVLCDRPLPAGRGVHLGACAFVVTLLLAMDAAGFVAAWRTTAALPFWKGTAVAAPLLSPCGPATVHVNWPAWHFALAAHAPETIFVDVRPARPPPADNPHPDCRVLGWAEHLMADEDFMTTASDRQLLDLLRIAAPPAEVAILRHGQGFVVLRADAAVAHE